MKNKFSSRRKKSKVTGGLVPHLPFPLNIRRSFMDDNLLVKRCTLGGGRKQGHFRNENGEEDFIQKKRRIDFLF